MKICFVTIGAEQLALSLLSGIAKQQGHDESLPCSAPLFHYRWKVENQIKDTCQNFLLKLFQSTQVYQKNNHMDKSLKKVL